MHNKEPIEPQACSISQSWGASCERGIANYLSLDHYEVFSQQAACLSFVGMGGGGGAGDGEAMHEQSAEAAEFCPADPGEISSLAADVWLSAYEGDPRETLCRESDLLIQSLSGPLIVEFYALGNEGCDATRTLLGRVSVVASSEERVPAQR